MMTETLTQISKIKKVQEDYEEIRVIKELIKEKPSKDFILNNDVLRKYADGKETLVIPKQMQTEIIRLPMNMVIFP